MKISSLFSELNNLNLQEKESWQNQTQMLNMLYDASSSKTTEEVTPLEDKSPQDELNEIFHAITKLSSLGIGEYDIDDVIFNIPTVQDIGWPYQELNVVG